MRYVSWCNITIRTTAGLRHQMRIGKVEETAGGELPQVPCNDLELQVPPLNDAETGDRFGEASQHVTYLAASLRPGEGRRVGAEPDKFGKTWANGSCRAPAVSAQTVD